MTRRAMVILVGLVMFQVACGGGSSTPTSPSVSAPPPTTTTVVLPPAAPPAPAPPATPFSGRWAGNYVIDRCDGTGSVQDLLCGARRGAFPIGTSLPIDLHLTQTGSTVSGTLSLGQITGVVSGAIRSSGLLTLTGVARSGTATATLTYWDTAASGNTMNGYFNFNATYVDIPGVAAVSARLSNVRK